VLECFNEKPAVGIAEIASVLRSERSTVHRYATTLVRLGWLEQDTARKYRLAQGALRVGQAVLEEIVQSIGAEAILAQLRDWTGYTVSLGVLDEHRVTFVRRWHAHGPGQYEADLELRAGSHVPLHCTALGKALLVSLDPERREGLLGRLC
jgi:DNA-binding IclR family transcriptional regulator